MQSMWTGLSALNASQNWLQSISNNVANQNTVGYGQTSESFADMLTSHLTPNATAPGVAGRFTAPGWWGGTGVFSVQEENNFNGQSIQQTGGNLNFALSGNNFFVVQGPNGQEEYTKAGDFQLSANTNGTATLVSANGQPVLDVNRQPIKIPKGVTNIHVSPNGQIDFGHNQVGQRIAVAQVGTPSQFLTATGNNIYALGQGGTATIVNQTNTPAVTVDVMQGYLNASNVDLTAQMTKMLQAQQLYEESAKSIQISNQMMQIDNQIKP